jgi:hypothetical protein
LDQAAAKAVSLTLTRYPAEQLIQARTPTRLDIGGGAAVDVTSTDGRLSVNVASVR